VKRRNIIAFSIVVSSALVLSGAVAASARPKAAAKVKPEATEIGVSPTTIRIAVVADVDNPLVPGIFQSSVDAVNGAAKLINAQGGIGGRKVQVDFIDSKLNANAARNAIITACSQDFALVGTTALFLPNVDDEINCKDLKGQAVGLPDLGALVFGVPEQCSPVSFPVNVAPLLCATKDQHPQTYQGNQADSTYFLKRFGKNLHGAYVLPNDTKDATRGDAVLAAIAVQAGIKADQTALKSGRDPQSAYTPIIQQMKNDNSNYGWSGMVPGSVIELRQEAQLQGLTNPKIIWACNTACYDRNYLKAGDAVEGSYIPMPYLPFEEANTNKALANFLKYVGPDKVSGLGVFAYTSALALQQVLNDVVAKDGVNAITRTALLDGLKRLTSFDAGGMIGPTNVAKQKASPCGLIVQVKNGKFVRVYPKKKGTFDCTPSNYVTVKADLIGN
jgi:ABC-type branched-subunit amino acid transport system substrate-binding protein